MKTVKREYSGAAIPVHIVQTFEEVCEAESWTYFGDTDEYETAFDHSAEILLDETWDGLCYDFETYSYTPEEVRQYVANRRGNTITIYDVEGIYFIAVMQYKK